MENLANEMHTALEFKDRYRELNICIVNQNSRKKDFSEKHAVCLEMSRGEAGREGQGVEENFPEAILGELSISTPVWPQSSDKVASVQEADAGKATLTQQLWLCKSHTIAPVNPQEPSKTPSISVYLACLCVRDSIWF